LRVPESEARFLEVEDGRSELSRKLASQDPHFEDPKVDLSSKPSAKS